MKKKLLTVGFLVLFVGIGRAQVLTHVGADAKLYVGSGALVYSGGDFQLNSTVEKSVENKGSITIVGNYLKGGGTGASEDGKEFVNVYTDVNDYGQVQILGGGALTDARMTVQRPAASSSYFNATFPVAFPYKDNVKYFMTSFGKAETDFKGDCAIGANCGPSIYNMTLRKWNNNKLVNDAVPSGAAFVAGDYYLVNLRDTGMQNAMTGIIGYKGLPSPGEYNATAKGLINGYEATFSDLDYNTWKEYVNQYNEKYKTYLGDISSTSKTYAKNTYRFGNPYTSNLDLSAFDGANAWLFIKNNSGNRTIKQATTDLMIKDFYVSKRTSSYGITWNPVKGSEDNNTSGSSTYHKAMFDGTQWTGDAQALLIRPFETFNLNFPLIDPSATKLGSRIIDIEVKFGDNHKTYSYSPSGTIGSTPVPYGRVSSGALKTESTTQKLASNTYNFYQAGIFLVNNDKILGSPAFLVGSNYNTESGSASTNTNDVYAFGINPDTSVAYNSKKDFNTFNTDTYIGKPMGIGFNNLVLGNQYELRFNLYEGSIFNEVKDLSADKFYLLDKENQKVTEISSANSYKFVVSNSDYNSRFEIYWKSYSPTGTLGTDVVKNDNKSTFIYSENAHNKVRFEKSGKAELSIYEMGGKLITSIPNVSTTNDYILPIDNNRVYVVIVKYNDGTVRTIKTIK